MRVMMGARALAARLVSLRAGTVARRACLVVVALCTIAALQLAAAPAHFLWKVTGPRGGTMFLAGSLHLLTSEYYPLAPAFDEAFAQADLLVEELDLGEMMASSSQMLMLQRGMMPAGQTLESVLTPRTMTAVKAKVTEMGLPMAPLQLFKPWALALTLQGLEWQKAGFDPELGLDRHFFDRATAKNVGVQGLESLDFQIAQFDGLSMPLQDKMLSDTLKEMGTTQEAVGEMARAWNTGDAPAIERIVLRDLKSDPQMYQRLLVDRNRTWLPKLEALFARPTPAFVVVGAAHLVGSDGLIAILKAKGYTVVQQ